MSFIIPLLVLLGNHLQFVVYLIILLLSLLLDLRLLFHFSIIVLQVVSVHSISSLVFVSQLLLVQLVPSFEFFKLSLQLIDVLPQLVYFLVMIGLQAIVS